MSKAFRINIRHPGTPVASGSTERERFWNALAIRVRQMPQSSGLHWEMIARELSEAQMRSEADVSSKRGLEQEYDALERELERYFPHRLLQVIWESRGDGGLGLELKFAVFSIGYGSLEILLGALGVEKTAAIYGLALPTITSIIQASVPEALRKTLNLPQGIDFDVTMIEEDVLSASLPVGQPDQAAPDTPPARVAAAVRALSLLNFSYLGPILLAIAVLYFASTAALDAIKTATTERTILMQQYAELTKQQLSVLSDERKEIAKLVGAVLHEASVDHQALVEALRKIATEEHGQSLEIVRPFTEKGHEAQGGSQLGASSEGQTLPNTR